MLGSIFRFFITITLLLPILIGFIIYITNSLMDPVIYIPLIILIITYKVRVVLFPKEVLDFLDLF
jgi:hypothetical protein